MTWMLRTTGHGYQSCHLSPAHGHDWSGVTLPTIFPQPHDLRHTAPLLSRTARNAGGCLLDEPVWLRALPSRLQQK